MARGSELRKAAKRGNLELLRELVEEGVDVNSRGGYCQTALHLAAERGHADAVEFLLEKGAAVNGKGPDGFTALHFAADSASARTIALLLAAGANAKATSSGGKFTPLFRAINPSEPSAVLCVRLLLQAGAEVNYSTSLPCMRGWTPLVLALDHGRRDLVKVLLHAGAAITDYPKNMNGPSFKEDPLFALVDRVKKAGGWAEFAKQHERVLAGLVSKCAPIPDDAARLVVEFWTPPGGS